MNRFIHANGRAAYSARRFVKEPFDISAFVIAFENKPGDGLASKRSFYCKSILDFVETHVCSLVYRFAFFTDRLWRLHFASCQGDMAMNVRA
jgi:hypothetical protein